MSSLSDVVKCTLRDGAVWMHLDNVRVHIPSHLLSKSQLLTDALSSTEDSSGREMTLPAPKEWLHAWISRYGSEEERPRCANVKDLVHCLLVRFFL
jgi:hypothetical protein